MNKIHRDNIDIQVAFISQSNRHRVGPTPAQIQDTAPANEAITLDHINSISLPNKRTLLQRLKATLRPLAQRSYRVLKPVFRPLAFRSRRFLTDSIRQEMLAGFAQIQTTLQQGHGIHDAIQEQLHHLYRHVNQEMETLRATLTQDLQFAAQTQSQHVANCLSLEIQTARVSLAQHIANNLSLEIHAVQTSLAQHIANSLGQEIQAVLASLTQHAQEAQLAAQTQAQDIANSLGQEIQAVLVSLTQLTQGAQLAGQEHSQQRHDNLSQEVQAFKNTWEQHSQIATQSQRFNDSLSQDILAYVTQLFPRLDQIERASGAIGRRIINCGQDEVLVKSTIGVYIFCSARDHAVLVCLADIGELEPGTRLLIQHFLRPGDVFIDVGAHLGLHTLAAALALKGQGKIIAFEPFESTKRLLEKSVQLNGFAPITEIHQAAVSDKTGQQPLFLGRISGHHSLFPLDVLNEDSIPHVDVPLVTLDSIIKHPQKVDLVKIDAEGAELDILAGAQLLVKNNPDIALIVEFGPAHLKRTNQTPHDWLLAFTCLGFDYRAIHPESGMLEDWSLTQLESVDSINLFFARPKSSAWQKTEDMMSHA